MLQNVVQTHRNFITQLTKDAEVFKDFHMSTRFWGEMCKTDKKVQPYPSQCELETNLNSEIKRGKPCVMWSIYSPVGTRSAVRRPPVCRCQPRARSAPSRTAETRLAPPPSRPRVLPTTSPACPASRSRSSASWCPACPGRPPAPACPAESHGQYMHVTPSAVQQLLFPNVSNIVEMFPDHREEKEKPPSAYVVLPGKNVNTV